MGKIKKISSLKKIITRLKKENKRIVFTNGCFDLIHPGHIKVLKDAKRQGDVLVVGLNSDSSVKKIKGKTRPILDEEARAEMLEAIAVVDYIVIFSEENPYSVIKEIKPDVLVKGGDWSKKEIIGGNLVGKIYRVKLKPSFSSTRIIEKIKRSA